MIISVKSKHIRMGVRGDSKNCPVALALHDAGFDGAEVSTQIHGPCFWCTYKAPRSVIRFVRNFDQRKKVKPFNFKLTL